ncbi:hypothetical protein [Bacillus cereus group sp. TH152-1LC]|uniref:hypothetical protein n=1 Tax=Bacillus cereus group sp. TH152-1LC TaxID=3018060 RepID=UPI0022E9928B|nr:hypothetical protein [Bacillus cereus group sp. TH152-1LC]MDA1675308.1 hypothetical protein [Bacillus cereus group sp. TH152-1LC]
MALELKAPTTIKHSDEHITVGDYVVYSVLPHLNLRIAGILEGPLSDYYLVYKVGETESAPAFIPKNDIYLEKPSPLRYAIPHFDNFKNVYHTKSKDGWWVSDVRVSYKGHRFDSVVCTQASKTETFPLQDVMFIRQAHCKNGRCKASLDIDNNRGVCPDCGWFICNKCGSHGCDEIKVDNKIRDYLCYIRGLKNPNFKSEVGPFTPMPNV